MATEARKVDRELDQRVVDSLIQQLFHIRWLTPADEGAFIELLMAVYGQTYSYRELYRPGHFSNLILGRKTSSYGEFDPETGKLISHIGFHHKDPRGDYVLCGTGFKHPRIVKMDGETQRRNWKHLLNHFSKDYSFIHQETSTYHPLAQMHSRKFMQAKATGLILDYVCGERLAKIGHTDRPMVALTMTTVLNPSSQAVFLPEGDWGAWVRLLYSNLGLERSFNVTSVGTSDYRLHTFEVNEAISLRRASLKRGEGKRDEGSLRNELVHVDLTDPEQVSFAFRILLSQGYFPVSLRPGNKRGDELVLQRLSGTQEKYLSQLSEAKLHGDEAKRIATAWGRCYQGLSFHA